MVCGCSIKKHNWAKRLKLESKEVRVEILSAGNAGGKRDWKCLGERTQHAIGKSGQETIEKPYRSYGKVIM